MRNQLVSHATESVDPARERKSLDAAYRKAVMVRPPEPLQPTFCETCDNVHSASRKDHPARWLCIRFPVLEGLSAVAPRTWVERQPFNRCHNINKGYCPLWTPLREPAA